MESNSFVSIDEVVAFASSLINDDNFELQSNAMYKYYAKLALEELAITTFFNIVTEDFVNWNSEENGTMCLPDGVFNIRNVMLFNFKDEAKKCSCSCKCNKSCWADFKEAFYKVGFNKFGKTGVSTANIVEGWNPSPAKIYIGENDVIYFNTQSGRIAFSDSAKVYKNLRIEFNGFGSNNKSLPIVPQMFRLAVAYKTAESVLMRAKNRDKSRRTDWADIQDTLYRTDRVGIWGKAKRLASQLDTKKRKDLNMYYENMQIK